MTESENMHTVYPSKWKLRTGVMILMSGSIVFVSKVDIKGRESYITIKGRSSRKHIKCKYIFAQHRHI